MGSFLNSYFNVEYKGLDETKPTVYDTLSGIKETAITNIGDAENKNKVDEYYSGAKTDMYAEYIPLSEVKVSCKSWLDSKYTNVKNKLSEDKIDTLNGIYSNGLAAIENAQTEAAAYAAYDSYKAQMEAL